MIRFRPSSNKTFWKRFRDSIIFWGLPMICLELIGAPRDVWGLVVLFAIPGTILGLFIYTLVEHGIIRYIQHDSGRDQPSAGDGPACKK